MITKIGFECEISNKKEKIESASKLVLPGVGAFDNGIKNLKELDLIDILNNKAFRDRTPILGICLGMQLMSEGSEEGTEKGLGWIPQIVKKLNAKDCKETTIPILGWNYINTIKKNEILTMDKQRFYFVHSYYFPKSTPGAIAYANVGFDYCVAFQQKNIYGIQFHPEKSHIFGKNLLHNFCNLSTSC
jgi:glutamine amidotransferase